MIVLWKFVHESFYNATPKLKYRLVFKTLVVISLLVTRCSLDMYRLEFLISEYLISHWLPFHILSLFDILWERVTMAVFFFVFYAFCLEFCVIASLVVLLKFLPPVYLYIFVMWLNHFAPPRLQDCQK